ncbi:hypothetical protein SELMODRAFT_233669 [Selaginella moellendorffii]|uniref:OTU domain-containing protein n=2 Tax=Selaginella moellendorffii TaxID=88036 RepID=D8SCW5_SELML|nr:OTU domain-containing protein 6B [Selaginella moellendorffii]EFJ17779.1 hypothetical protein SELMODRAFT_233669 [Selaginella moellendorffii]|eukprot:XP_002981078.1 OTU domain-containing protein 6B [Selaginella moellendorffii]
MAVTEAESRMEMLSRHQQEIKELRNREIELKKAAAKGSKAEQKAKKKAIEEEISGKDAAMKERQARELATLGFAGSEDTNAGRLDGLVRAIAGVGVSSAAAVAAPPRISKGKKWRDRRAQQDAEREQRIQDEQALLVSDRKVEEDVLAAKLQPLGLSLKEIKPDGHCLYRAVEDQLQLHPSAPQYSFQELRKIAAGYIREHPEDFVPFIGGDVELEDYCREIESTAAWGGQLELEALSHALQKHIFVFSAEMAIVEMGSGFQRDGTNPSIKLSYHKHAFGLGEHYNSLVPA